MNFNLSLPTKYLTAIEAMKNEILTDAWIEEMLTPETALEEQIANDPEFRAGLLWGKPRFGHPEGKIILHIREVLDNVERLSTQGLSANDRRDLRLITYLHDSFKYLEDKAAHPRDWSKHHAVYARAYAEKYIKDKVLLDIIELHDDAYYSWRFTHLYNQPEKGQKRLVNLLQCVGSRLQLYYLFFKCDTRTGDKNQAPLKWFEKTVEGITLVDL